MKIIGISEQKKATMSEIFENNSYYSVPIFQREYSWRSDMWSDLADDVEGAIENESQHFFGFIMFKPEKENDVSVIEGQQRLATITIVICVIRDILFQLDLDLYKKLEQLYIKRTDIFYRDSPPKYKVSLSKVDNSFFRENIQEIGKPVVKIKKLKGKKIRLSNKLIYQCYQFFYKLLHDRISGLNEKDKENELMNYLEVLLNNFVVITTEVTDNKTAYNIFQTLNDRGLDLALADLLKVHLFEIAGDDDVLVAKDKWDEITTILGTINLNIFLRHFWVSKYNVISQKYLMDEFEDKIKTKIGVFQFLNDLKLEAEFYETIYNSSSDFWKSEIVDLIDELFILAKNIVLPLLLGTLPNLNEKDHKSFLKMCISFIFRYLTIAERENKEIESSFSKMAIEIRNGKLKNINDIRDRFIKMNVDDDTFISIFSKKDIKTAKVAKYILRKIELSLDPEKEKFSNKITLEHILPKSPNEKWNKYLKDKNIDKDEIVDKIGNLTLLLGKVNKKAQNHFFDKKRDLIYSKMTELKINEWLANIDSWTTVDVQTRQDWLAKKAVNIWKI